MHYSVMLKEAIEFLNIKEDGIYVDGTIGLAGHSSEILKRIPNGYLYGFDQDDFAIEKSNERLSKIGTNYKLIKDNFVNLKKRLEENSVSLVDGIILDLGVSSPQIDDKNRGFSFMNDAVLDMRMDRDKTFSALNVLNDYSYEDLRNIFFKYGEERYSNSIAKNIINARKTKQIKSTKELTEIIKSSVPLKYFMKNHPERQIFQAIRIEVNDELNVLKSVLPDAISLLKKNGRLVVITFHSLEDRIVKQTFKEYSEVNEIVKGLPNIPDEYKPLIKLINTKPLIASKEEIKENKRSLSAKMRIVERI